MVDYSKWDKIELSDDNSDNSDRETPQVTRFDKPQSVTIGTRSIKKEDNRSNNTLLNIKDSDVSNKHQNLFDIAFATRNGGCGPTYMWSQTAFEVVSYILIDMEARGSDVSVVIPKSQDHTNVSFDNEWRTCGTDVEITLIKRKKNSKDNNEITTVLKGKIEYPVLTEDEYIFWELKTFNGIKNNKSLSELQNTMLPFPVDAPFKVLILTLRKSCPIANAILWWQCFLKDDPKIDVTLIPDRRRPKNQSEESFRQIWETANQEFCRRRKIDQQEDNRTIV